MNAACALLLLFVMAAAVAEAEAVAGGSHWRARSSFFDFHPQNHYNQLIFQFEFSSKRPPRINKNFRFSGQIIKLFPK